MNIITMPNKLFVIKTVRSNHIPTAKVIDWLKDNKEEHYVRSIREIGKDEIRYLIESIALDLPNGRVNDLRDLIHIPLGKQYKLIMDEFKEHNINIAVPTTDDIVNAINLNRNLLRYPILIKNEIATIGFDLENIQQYLTTDRDNPKWLGADLSLTDKEKVEWVINQYQQPEEARQHITQLYFPESNALYGGKIKWEYPIDFVDSSNTVVKVGIMNVKMSIKLNDTYEEREFLIDIKPF